MSWVEITPVKAVIACIASVRGSTFIIDLINAVFLRLLSFAYYLFFFVLFIFFIFFLSDFFFSISRNRYSH